MNNSSTSSSSSKSNQAVADINKLATGPKADYIVANVGVRKPTLTDPPYTIRFLILSMIRLVKSGLQRPHRRVPQKGEQAPRTRE